jgi:hypothetical protein
MATTVHNVIPKKIVYAHTYLINRCFRPERSRTPECSRRVVRRSRRANFCTIRPSTALRTAPLRTCVNSYRISVVVKKQMRKS